MTLWTLLRFWIGDRNAIRAIAADPRSLPVGFLFVLSAALAREYDAEDLLAEPWHLAIPLVASLVSSSLLYFVVWCTARWGGARPPLLGVYPRFLALFWATAPFAWLYAIPYERLLGELEAVQANLLTLLAVSVVRVVLMIRVVSVQFGTTWRVALFPVLLFSDTLALLSLTTIPFPIIAIMGGVRLSPAEALLREVASWILLLGLLSWPVWVFGALAARWAKWSYEPLPLLPAQPARGPLGLAALAILAGLAALPLTQPEQRRRHAVETHLARGEVAHVASLLTAHPRDAFPPHWDPPPRPRRWPGFSGASDLVAVLDQVQRAAPASWAYQAYLARLERELELGLLGRLLYSLEDEDGVRLHRLLALLSRMPEGRRLASEHRPDLEHVVERIQGSASMYGRPGQSWPAALRLARALLEDSGAATSGVSAVSSTSR